MIKDNAFNYYKQAFFGFSVCMCVCVWEGCTNSVLSITNGAVALYFQHRGLLAAVL